MKDAITNKSAVATIWAVAGFGARSGLRLAGNLILARLLIPEDFGMMALIAILMQGLVMFSDVGIGPSIIRSKRGEDPDFLNTAWTVQVIRGLTIWVCTAVLALPFADFYNEPKFVALIPVACLNVFIAGFNNTALFTENRALNLGRITAVEIVSQIAGLLIMVGWAIVSPTVWALIAGGIVSAVTKASLSHLLFLSKRNSFRWEPAAFSELIKFGKWIFLSSSLAFISAQIDRILLGRLVSLDILGIYSIGFMWARASFQLALTWSQKVFFPVASKIISAGKTEDAKKLLDYRQNLLLVVGPVIAGSVVAMPKLIALLYLPVYQAAGQVGSIIAAGAWIGILNSTYSSIILAGGKPQYISMATAAQTFLFLLLVFPLFDLWHINGVALSVIISQIGAYVFSAAGARRIGYSRITRDLVFTLLVISFIALLWKLSLFTGNLYGSIITDLIVIGSVSCLASSISFFLGYFRRMHLKDTTPD